MNLDKSKKYSSALKIALDRWKIKHSAYSKQIQQIEQNMAKQIIRGDNQFVKELSNPQPLHREEIFELTHL